jgi:5-methylcytosine-specific restriction endonuclease McrA
VRFSRKNVWIRDEGRCQYCANHVSINVFTLDHVLPKTRGGKTSWTNVVTCCVTCNQRKGDKSLATCGMKLLKPAVKPAILPYIHDVEYFFNFDSKMPESWRFWLGATL